MLSPQSASACANGARAALPGPRAPPSHEVFGGLTLLTGTGILLGGSYFNLYVTGKGTEARLLAKATLRQLQSWKSRAGCGAPRPTHKTLCNAASGFPIQVTSVA